MKCTKKIVLLIVTTVSALFMMAMGYKTDAEVPKVAGEIQQIVEANKGANEYYENGRCFLYGLNGTEYNVKMAYECFIKARELGMKEASFYLGALCDWYGYPKRDFVQAKMYYEECGDNPFAQISLGFLYLNGMGVAQDKSKADNIFQTVINAGYPEGYFGFAGMEREKGNDANAMQYYITALGGSEPLYTGWIMYEIGECYQYGIGVEQDYTKAMEWYQMASTLGNSEAMNGIGYMYLESQNYSEAMKWLQMSAKLNNGTAMKNIGYMYENGLGVQKDLATANEWYQMKNAIRPEETPTTIQYFFTNKYSNRNFELSMHDEQNAHFLAELQAHPEIDLMTCRTAPKLHVIHRQNGTVIRQQYLYGDDKILTTICDPTFLKDYTGINPYTGEILDGAAAGQRLATNQAGVIEYGSGNADGIKVSYESDERQMFNKFASEIYKFNSKGGQEILKGTPFGDISRNSLEAILLMDTDCFYHYLQGNDPRNNAKAMYCYEQWVWYKSRVIKNGIVFPRVELQAQYYAELYLMNFVEYYLGYKS